MHSKILQISKSPIGVSDYVRERRYYDDFVGSIADYVDSCDREKVLEDLFVNYGGFRGLPWDADKQSFTVDKESYFRAKYEHFSETVGKLVSLSFEDFAGQNTEGAYAAEHLLWYARYYFDDNHAIYVDDCDEYYGMVTMDYLIRHANQSDVFYIGNVIDYHF